ncbi:MAG TPA: TspO/MBR family protein [Longimicrobiales bacterium]|nr:TspO/MBR family protein [Longimicrobiales bacterium]
MSRWLGLAIWIALPMIAGVVGSQFAPGAWFDALRKPPFNPPSWVFAPVWTTLYVAMGVAAWLVWDRHRTSANPALALFVIQLVANAMWSWLFFGRQSPGAALVDIVVLWFLILGTMWAFWRLRPAAGMLLLPYIAWVTFATALNFEIWRLN